MRSRASAIVVGSILALLPFLVYGTSGHPHAPHADHAPRHGGDLFMLGDYHVEIVQRGQRVELFVSDAVRRPLQPEAGSVAFEGGARRAMQWRNPRLVAAVPPGERVDRVTVTLEAGRVLDLDL